MALTLTHRSKGYAVLTICRGIIHKIANFRIRGNPIFERRNIPDLSPLVILDPTSYMIKNIATSSHRISEVLEIFREYHFAFKRIKKEFMNELDNELKTDSGVKKDYFLNYFKTQKENRVLGFDSKLCLRVLDLDFEG